MFGFLWLQPICVQTKMAYNGLGSVSTIPFSDLKSKINLSLHGSELPAPYKPVFKLWPYVLNASGLQEVSNANVITTCLLHHLLLLLLLFYCMETLLFALQV